MMSIEKPDLSNADPKVIAYIKYLEEEVIRLRSTTKAARKSLPPEPSEPPTTDCLVILSKNGQLKRTYRHLYTRQRRGGMGIFDIETDESDPPLFMTLAEEGNDLLMITDFGRGYRLPISSFPEKQIRERGLKLTSLLDFQESENVRLLVPAREQGYLALVSERGYVRLLRHNYLSPKMRPGSPLFDTGRFGPVATGCWTTGEDELFIATRTGKAIRFREKMVHANGSLGIRLDRGDTVVGITGIKSDSKVLLIGSDGRGTIRMMSGFTANKAPGSGGKIAMKTDHLIGASTVEDNDDIFVISQLSKIIRFPAIEIPSKTGVVQGVNCMALRADQVSTFTVIQLP
jgi:DNA gyrase subunit A